MLRRQDADEFGINAVTAMEGNDQGSESILSIFSLIHADLDWRLAWGKRLKIASRVCRFVLPSQGHQRSDDSILKGGSLTRSSDLARSSIAEECQ